jgi:protein-tyrosine-phosphatase
MQKVIFACIHNAGRSQMAAAFFNQLADRTKAEAVSAGTEPGLRVHPEVLAAMHEIGIDLSAAKPQKLTKELANDAALLITMGCGDKCPYVPAFAEMTGHCPIRTAVPWMRFVLCATISRFVLQNSYRLRDWKRRQRDCSLSYAEALSRGAISLNRGALCCWKICLEV